MEVARILVSSDTEVNVLLSRPAIMSCIQKTSRKDRNHFLMLMISHLYHPNQTQTQTNKITRRPWMHHLVNITPTHLMHPLKHIYFNNNQIQKKSYPQKRRLSFHQLFHENRLKHNPIQDQCQSNWFQQLNNLHLLNSPARIKVK